MTSFLRVPLGTVWIWGSRIFELYCLKLWFRAGVREKCTLPFHGLFFYVLHDRFHFLHTFHRFHFLLIFFVFGFLVITSELHFTLFISANRISLFGDFFENRRVNVNLQLHFFHAPFLRDHEWDSQKNKIFVHLHKQSVNSKYACALFPHPWFRVYKCFVLLAACFHNRKRVAYVMFIGLILDTPHG